VEHAGPIRGLTLKRHRMSRLVFRLQDSKNPHAEPVSLYFYDQRNFGTPRVSFDKHELEAKLQSAN